MASPMITTHDLYEGIKSLTGKDSAYAVGKYLGASRVTAGSWRDGRTTMDDAYAIRAAEALNLDPDYVLACLASERAAKGHHLDTADAWARIALRLATAASICFLLVIPFLEMQNPAF